MNKEILGNHTIDIGTVVIDNKTHLSYEVIGIYKEGLLLNVVSIVGKQDELFLIWDRIENGFINSDISISGYEISDSKILHLVINDFKRSQPAVNKVMQQIRRDGYSTVKKKVKKISLKGL